MGPHGYPGDDEDWDVLEDWQKTLSSLKAEYLSEIEGDESVLGVDAKPKAKPLSDPSLAGWRR